MHLFNRPRAEPEPKNCGNSDRQRSEANYEKHGSWQLPSCGVTGPSSVVPIAKKVTVYCFGPSPGGTARRDPYYETGIPLLDGPRRREGPQSQLDEPLRETTFVCHKYAKLNCMMRERFMNPKLFAAALVIISLPVCAHAEKPTAAKVTNADAQKVVKMIGNDKAKIQIYCDSLNLATRSTKRTQKIRRKSMS
jgi:hypothetical protein